MASFTLLLPTMLLQFLSTWQGNPHERYPVPAANGGGEVQFARTLDEWEGARTQVARNSLISEMFIVSVSLLLEVSAPPSLIHRSSTITPSWGVVLMRALATRTHWPCGGIQLAHSPVWTP